MDWGGWGREFAGRVSDWERCGTVGLAKLTAPTRSDAELFRRKQIPLYVPRPPKCGGKEKARDFFRDDM
jgi:hypothetical protein